MRLLVMLRQWSANHVVVAVLTQPQLGVVFLVVVTHKTPHAEPSSCLLSVPTHIACGFRVRTCFPRQGVAWTCTGLIGFQHERKTLENTHCDYFGTQPAAV